jgi:hypothetical protein
MFLRFQLAVGVIPGLMHVIQVGEEGWHGDEHANKKAKEEQPEELLPSMVDTDKDSWEGFEPDVENGVDEADVDIESEYNRLLKVERRSGARGSRWHDHGVT